MQKIVASKFKRKSLKHADKAKMVAKMLTITMAWVKLYPRFEYKKWKNVHWFAIEH